MVTKFRIRANNSKSTHGNFSKGKKPQTKGKVKNVLMSIIFQKVITNLATGTYYYKPS